MVNGFLKLGIVILIVGSLVLPFAKTIPRQDLPTQALEPEFHLTILFVGDVMQHKPQIDAAWNPVTNTYDYDSCFVFVKEFISSFDLAIANLEVTLGGPPYSGYPQFSAPDPLAVALKNAGFDILATANNHSCDRNRKGIERTIAVLDSLNIPHFGTYINADQRKATYPLIVNSNGIRLALLNYTYGTNGLNVPEPNIVNDIDSSLMASDLKAAKDSAVDKIIVFIHWGDEYQSHPNEWQQEIASFLFANGADIIIGSHPHVLQRMERKFYPDSSGREVILVYSLGNYISNQRDRGRDGGASITFELTKKNGKTEIGWTNYYLNWVWIPQKNGARKYFVVPVDNPQEAIKSMDATSLEKFNTFVSDSRKLYGENNLSVPEGKSPF